MKLRLLGPLVLSAVVACHVVLLGDLEVFWEIDGNSSVALCSTYNIGHWHVVAHGPERISKDVDCGGAWTTGTWMFGVEEGYYDVTVEAVEEGTGQVLAAVVQGSVRVISGDPPATPLIQFQDSDFVVGGDTLNVYWNINGTEDGTAKGISWDTCSEVGATGAEVEVNGTSTIHDCHAGGNMSASVTGFSGKPQVRVRLLDSSDQPLTTWTNTASADADGTGKWQYIAEFFWDSFLTLKDTMKGDYLFQVSYEGQSCMQTTPSVAHQVSLLSLDGSPVNPAPSVCGPDNICVSADGASFASCYGPDQTQDISDILWREYKIKVSGTLPASASYEICWEEEFDIVVGAGTTNPVDLLDIDRYSSAGACQ